jgi:hypothetical protein
MRQRLGVARCLLADPLLLIFDEPTNGLDPGGIQEFREMVRVMVEQEGRTVFISSHLLDEVEKICDHAAIVDHGRVVVQGPISELAQGGTRNFSDGLRVIALFFGPLAALLIGVESGTGDASAGVFRDLVVTGRSRVALFASRVPAALIVTFVLMGSAYVLLLVGTFAFASSLPTPSTSLVLDGLGFTLLSTGMICAVAVGVAALVASKPGAIIALIAWQLAASPLLANIKSLGSSRDVLLSQGVSHFSPVSAEGGHGSVVTMSGGVAFVVLLAWLVVFLALGAWRTYTMDA